MDQFHKWVEIYCWWFVGVSWAVFCLLLLVFEIIPRATVVVETYHEWQSNKAEILKMDAWETQRFLTLKGVTGITAMVNGADDVIHFVVPSDSIGEVKILEVAKDHVLAKYANTTFTLNLKS